MRKGMAFSAGVALVCALALVVEQPPVSAGPATFESYAGGARAHGSLVTFAVTPSVFDPLLEAGGPVAYAAISSEGEGSAYGLASQLFPGHFLVGAIGCGGLRGGQWVQAQYPPSGACKSEQATTTIGLDKELPGPSGNPVADAVVMAVREHASLRAGELRAYAERARAGAAGAAGRYALRVGSHALLHAASVEATAGGRATARAHQRARIVAHDIALLGGAITLDTLISTAQAQTDGVTGSADASLQMSGVRVRLNGRRYGARIDEHGITIDDPALSYRRRAAVEEEVRETLARARVRVTAAAPVTTESDGYAEASIGGLVLSFSGTIPSVTAPLPFLVQKTVGETLEGIEATCLRDLGMDRLPVCVGPGTAPGPGSGVPLSLAVGTTRAFVVGGPHRSLAAVLDTYGSRADRGGAQVLGELLPLARPGAAAARRAGAAAEPRPSGRDPTPLVGVVARLPSAALLWPAIVLLLLAVAPLLKASTRDDPRV